MKIAGRLPLVVIAAALLGGLFTWNGIAIFEWGRNHLYPPPPSRSTEFGPLKQLASAEAYFKANDPKGIGIHEFWRKDVAGLYGALDSKGAPLRLIELRLALADERPVTNLKAHGNPAPRWGEYWCRAILHEGEDPKQPDPQRFAFAMTPTGTPKSDRYSYIIDENNTVFRAKVQSVSAFPQDPGKAGWSKLD